MASDKRALTNLLLGGALEELLVEWRLAGISWEAIARRISVETNSQIYVTSQTVRTWAAELEDVA